MFLECCCQQHTEPLQKGMQSCTSNIMICASQVMLACCLRAVMTVNMMKRIYINRVLNEQWLRLCGENICVNIHLVPDIQAFFLFYTCVKYLFHLLANLLVCAPLLLVLMTSFLSFLYYCSEFSWALTQKQITLNDNIKDKVAIGWCTVVVNTMSVRSTSYRHPTNLKTSLHSHEQGCHLFFWVSTVLLFTTILQLSSQAQSQSSPTTFPVPASVIPIPVLLQPTRQPVHILNHILTVHSLDLFCPFTFSQSTGDFDMAVPLSPLMRPGLWRKPT